MGSVDPILFILCEAVTSGGARRGLVGRLRGNGGQGGSQQREEAGQQARSLSIQPITRAGAGGGFD